MTMPEISRFFGIVVAMFYNDHAPPHFHARYGDDEVVMTIADFDVQGGRLSRRAMGLLIEWAIDHRDELQANWVHARNGEPMKPIAPLE